MSFTTIGFFFEAPLARQQGVTFRRAARRRRRPPWGARSKTWASPAGPSTPPAGHGSNEVSGKASLLGNDPRVINPSFLIWGCSPVVKGTSCQASRGIYEELKDCLVPLRQSWQLSAPLCIALFCCFARRAAVPSSRFAWHSFGT